MVDTRSKEQVYADCEQKGEVAVRAQIKAADSSGGSISYYIRQWLEEIDAQRKLQREAEQREQNAKALVAAEISAAASERAASAAKESARWTMWTAVIALIAIIVQWLTR